MKIIVGPGAKGRVAARTHFEGAVLNPGEYVTEVPEDVHVSHWANARVWDASTGTARLPAASEALEAARTAKQEELEHRFDEEAVKNLGPRTYLGILIYVEQPTDPRSVATKSARSNLANKLQALADLGKPGKPALTFENIAGIGW